MNPYIDDDLVALGEHARRFAQGRVAPGFLERDQTRVLDRTLMREMACIVRDAMPATPSEKTQKVKRREWVASGAA